jgi:phosphoesterase RecJ-like protein
MSYQDELAAAGRFLKDNDHFLVVNHVQPDGDATGSLLAVAHVLKALGKQFTLVNEGSTPAKFRFLPLCNEIVNLSDQPLAQTFHCVITVDCGDFGRVGRVVDYIDKDADMLNIDHHPTNDGFGTTNLIRTDACATAEILYDLVQQMGLPISRDLGSCLYTGLLTDTGGFRYANTNSQVLRKASDLLEAGVSPSEIAERCLETIPSSYISLLKEVLPTLTMEFNGSVSSLSVSTDALLKSKASPEDTEGLISYARNIEGVEVGILYKQVDQETVKVSFRSKSKVDVSVIAKDFGGGGHVRAAGCTMKGSLEQVKQQVHMKLKDALRFDK